MAQLNYVDAFFFLIFALSILIGFMRGFLREVIAVATWVAATAVSTLFSGKLAASISGGANQETAGFLANHSDITSQSTSALSIGGSFMALFIGTMVMGSIINYLVTGVTNYSGLNLPNRFLGAVFGAVRAALLTIVLIFIAQFTAFAGQSAFAESDVVKTFQPAVTYISTLIAPSLATLRTKAQQASDVLQDKMKNIADTFTGQ